MIDIKPQIIARFGEDYVGVSGDEIVYHCPYCEENGRGPDTHGHLYVNNRSCLFYCQRCGAKGYVAPIGTDYVFDPIPSDEELYLLLESTLGRSEKRDLFDIPPHLVAEGTTAFDYLKSRGISKSMIEHYSIRQGQVSNRVTRGRVVVPNEIFYSDDHSVEMTDMYVARYYRPIPKNSDTGKDKFPKYYNPPGAQKSKSVFNLHRIQMNSPIIICEGVFTAMSAGSSAVAIYGKQISNYQLALIMAKSPSAIYVALDPDAYSESLSLCYRINHYTDKNVYNVRLPDGEDANSLGHNKFMDKLMHTRVFDPIELEIRRILQ